MPLYEYQCGACGHRFEAVQRFSDPPLDTCPKCGGVLQKLQAAPAFHFKGSGWYITDYARKGAPADGGKTDGKAEGSGKDTAPSGAAEGAAGSSEKKTESKPESASAKPAEKS